MRISMQQEQRERERGDTMLLAYLEGDSGPRSTNYSQFQQYIMTGGDQSGTEEKK